MVERGFYLPGWPVGRRERDLKKSLFTITKDVNRPARRGQEGRMLVEDPT